MAGKLSAKAQATLGALEEAKRKWDRVHSLVEKVASARHGHVRLMRQIRRASEDVGRILANNGLPVLAENVNQIAVLIQRGGSAQRKVHKMRELVRAVRAGIERAERVTKEGDGAK